MLEGKRTTIIISCILGVGYVLLFHVSAWIDNGRFMPAEISLFFLPAVIRLLGVLLIGVWVSPALFLAVMYLTMTGAYDVYAGHRTEIAVAFTTALGGPLATLLVAKKIHLSLDLSNLTAWRLLILSAACSAGNAAALGLTLAAFEPSLLNTAIFMPIFLGDMIGTWVTIYGIKLGLDLYCATKRR